MNIGIVSAGILGTPLAKRIGLAGHTVRFAAGGDPVAVAESAGRMGAGHLPSDRLAAWSSVVALAVPWPAVPAAVSSVGDLTGKVLWTAPSAPRDRLGLALATDVSSGEEVQRLAPGAKVVKGVPTFAELLNPDDPLVGGRPAGCSSRAMTPRPSGPLRRSCRISASDR